MATNRVMRLMYESKQVILLYLCSSILFISPQPHPHNWFSSKRQPAFHCDGIGQDVVRIEWFQVFQHDAFLIASSNKNYEMTKSTLRIRSNVLVDGDFFCEAESDRGRWRSRLAHLRFGSNSSFVGNSSIAVRALGKKQHFMFDGDSLRLSCAFEGHRRVQWLHNTHAIINDRTRQVTTGFGWSALHILNFDRTLHSGVYQCMVENSFHHWEPLKKPSETNGTVCSYLPFNDYEIATAGEVAPNLKNYHPPRVLASKGRNFSASISSSGVALLTSIVASDLDRGAGGVLTCNITCSRSKCCPTFSAPSANLSFFVGLVLLETEATKDIIFNLTCNDKGDVPKTANIEFEVTLERQIKNSSLVTISEELSHLAWRLIKNVTLQQDFSVLEALNNLLERNLRKFKVIDVSLASAILAESIEMLNQEITNYEFNVTIAQILKTINNILNVDSRVLRASEEAVYTASHLNRDMDKVTDMFCRSALGSNNQTLSTPNLELGYFEFNNRTKGGILTFQSHGDLNLTFVSLTKSPPVSVLDIYNHDRFPNIVAISLHVNQIGNKRVAFSIKSKRLFQL